MLGVSEVIRKELESFLEIKETIPPSLKEAAKQIGYAPSMLREHFPELCRTISARYKEALTVRKTQRLRMLCDETREAIFKLYKEGHYPSMSRVGNTSNTQGHFSSLRRKRYGERR